MDNDLDGQAWDELGELFPKSSFSSSLPGFQVQLNGDLALNDELSIPADGALPDGDVQLDGDLNPIPASLSLSPIGASPSPIDPPPPSSPTPSPAASRAASPPKSDADPATPPPSPPAAATTASPPAPAKPPGVSKPAAAGSLKAKRAREAAQYPSSLLKSLHGTTSAEVRKMTAKERDLVMYKRKLRNRESARRSRARRQATVAELQDEMGDLLEIAAGVVDAGVAARAENVRLRGKLDVANATIRALKAVYAPGAKLEVDDEAEAEATAVAKTPVKMEATAENASETGALQADEGAVAAKQAAVEEPFMPSMMQMGG